MKSLLDSGRFDINSTDLKKVTALHHAAANQKIDSLLFLYNYKKINKDVKDDHGVFFIIKSWSPLHYAVQNNRINAVLFFIRNKDVDFNAKDKNGVFFILILL